MYKRDLIMSKFQRIENSIRNLTVGFHDLARTIDNYLAGPRTDHEPGRWC